MGSRIASLTTPLLDLVFPPRCLACDADLGEEDGCDLCNACRDKITRISVQRCPRCGDRLGPHVPADRRCLSCRDMPLVFKRASAPCKYDGAVREMILNLKYRKQMAARRALAQLMIEDLARADFLHNIDVIVPVPLHWRRRFERGFNQAEMLAWSVGKHFSIQVCSNRLRRIRPTVSQTMLQRSQRLENLKGAFMVKGRNGFAGKTVLLCDDVMTTGATALECARALRAAGVKQVYVAVAAR